MIEFVTKASKTPQKFSALTLCDMLPLQARGKQKIGYQIYCTVHFVQDFAIALGHRPNSHEPDVPESDTAALPKCDIRNGSRNPICHNRLYAPRAHRGSEMTIPEFRQLATQIGEPH